MAPALGGLSPAGDEDSISTPKELRRMVFELLHGYQFDGDYYNHYTLKK